MIYFSEVIDMQKQKPITYELDEITSEINSSLVLMTGKLAIARNSEENKKFSRNTDMIQLVSSMEQCRDALNRNFQKLISKCSGEINKVNANINVLNSKLDVIQDEISQQSDEQHRKVLDQLSELTNKINDLNTQAFNNLADNVSNDQPDMQMLFDHINSQFEELKTRSSVTSSSADISQLNQQFEELKTKADETNDYTCSNLDALSSHVENLNKNITILYDLIKPPDLTRDYIEAAKYLIDNVKNNQGKSIKSGSITIPNVAAILEAYDRLNRIHKHK